MQHYTSGKWLTKLMTHEKLLKRADQIALMLDWLTDALAGTLLNQIDKKDYFTLN